MVLLPFLSLLWAAPATPPVAKKVDKVTEINGEKLNDPYYWLREKQSPEVIRYLEAENAYTDALTRDTEPLRKKLYDEFLSHLQENDFEVPFQKGNYIYVSRTRKGMQYPIWYRKRVGTELAKVMLDLNELAKGEKFLQLGEWEVSDDGRYLAYTLDTTGFRQYRLWVKDLKTNKLLADHAEKVGSLAWAADNQTIFYTVEDAAKRQYSVRRLKLGSKEEPVYEEKDERFSVDVTRSRSGRFLYLSIGSHTTSETRYLPAQTPLAEPLVVAPRVVDQEYQVADRADAFYIIVNDVSPLFRLVQAPVATPGRDHWTELLPARPDVPLEGVETFKNHLILHCREKGLPQVEILSFRAKAWHRLKLDEPVYSIAPENNYVWASPVWRYRYQSLITPPSVFDYEMNQKKTWKRKEVEVPGYDRNRYEAKRVEVTASDGTAIPVSLLYRKGTKRDGEHPVHLVGYGAYGINLAVGFSANRLSFLDRGVVEAFAHVRGGGEKGKPWHDAGRMMQKKNTFTDFIRVAEFLKESKIASPDRIAIEGRSAGGLLIGSVVNLRPELFRAAVLEVPFVDMMNTMLDPGLPLTVTEYEEWGNPHEKAAFDYMLSYSPYDNLHAAAYPSILVTTSLNDSQVMYWEPSKYVARLRTLKTDKNLLLLKVTMAGGHGGSSGRYRRLEEAAFKSAFLLHQLRVN